MLTELAAWGKTVPEWEKLFHVSLVGADQLLPWPGSHFNFFKELER